MYKKKKKIKNLLTGPVDQPPSVEHEPTSNFTPKSG